MEKYTFLRTLFGLYIIWLGIYNLGKLAQNEALIKHSVESFEELFSLEGIVNYFELTDRVPFIANNIKNLHINFEPFKNCSNELVYLMNVSLIIGGVLCFLGYSLSFSFIFIGLLLNIIFIHNYFYFRDEKMKVNVLKMVAMLGAAFQIV